MPISVPARRRPLPQRSELGRAHGGTRLGRRRGGEDPGQTRHAGRKGPVLGGVGKRESLLERKQTKLPTFQQKKKTKRNDTNPGRGSTATSFCGIKLLEIIPPSFSPSHGVSYTLNTVRKHL